MTFLYLNKVFTNGIKVVSMNDTQGPQAQSNEILQTLL
jgi:hypothetical protein